MVNPLPLLGRTWRMLATGFCFGVFGAGGLLLRVAVFPLLDVLVRDQVRRTNAAREIIRLTFRLFVGLMRTTGVLQYDVVGLERLERGGQLILANHPTLIDTIFLMAFVRNADCIVKGALWSNPFTRGPVRAAGYINNDQGLELVDACIDSLQAGNNLIVFPEGTRTPANGTIALKRGAANIAVRGAQLVTPVLIQCEPPTLGKGDKWWRVPAHRVHFRIQVCEDLDINPFLAGGATHVLAARRLTEHLQQFFTRETQRHA